ncbi:MAG: 3-dehydroquinate synthase [Clostridia bacterium]|nr:3-dehydroquinate synthase [Clostridia bacterium]
MASVRIEASKAYEVIIEKGILERCGEIIRNAAGGDSVCVVTDDTVDALYGERCVASLLSSGYRVEKFVIPHGEQSKNASQFIRLLNFLAQKRFTRTDTVAALGGGVVGDLAGFAASCFTRGMKFVQIPTTLLAAVDSSVGGKTAIDLDAGKNLAGAFYQPEVVICDYLTLDTLPDDIFADGCAEVIKYGVIADAAFFEFLKQPVRENIEKVITRCVELKRDVVAADEFDNGIRFILNYGHTVGHAVEANSDFTISHGKGVAIGMCAEARAAARMGICSADCADAVESLVRSYGLPTRSPYDVRTLTEKALSDKKRRGGTIGVVVPTEIGKCRVEKFPVEKLCDFIGAGIE